jgi:hypothetical protein
MLAELQILVILTLALSLPTRGGAQGITGKEKCPPEGFGAVRGVVLDNTGQPIVRRVGLPYA